MTSKLRLTGILNNKKTTDLIGKVLFIIPLLWGLALAASLVESLTYRGFVLKHTSINPIILYVSLAFIELLGLFRSKEKRSYIFMRFQKMNLILSITLCFLLVTSSFLEKMAYDNFVFSTFHLNIKNLVYPVVLTVYTDFVFFGAEYIIQAIFIVILIVILIGNLLEIWGKGSKDILYMICNLNDSYKTKMENELGKQFYDYSLFVKDYTPENSKILLPPFPAYPWPQTGNIPYMTYFLYPRTLLNGEEYSPNYDLEKEGIDYVLITWGETDTTSSNYTHGWPKFDVKAEKVVLQINESEKKEIPRDYIYKDVENKELWGIIKVKK